MPLKLNYSDQIKIYPRIYYDFMVKDEFIWLNNKFKHESGLFKKTIFYILVFLPIIPIFIGLIAANAPIDERSHEFNLPEFIVGACLTYLFVGLLIFITYKVSFKKINIDLQQKIKLVEVATIKDKMIIGSDQSCYFYLTSNNIQHITVPQSIFAQYQEGDEINVQFTGAGKFYLGYF